MTSRQNMSLSQCALHCDQTLFPCITAAEAISIQNSTHSHVWNIWSTPTFALSCFIMLLLCFSTHLTMRYTSTVSVCKFLLQICVHFCLSTFASLISLFACSYNVAFRYWENFERSFFPSTFVMIQESHPYWHTVLNTLSALNTLSCCHIFFNFMWLEIKFATKYYFCLVGVERDTQKNNNLQLAIYLGMYICA